MPRDITLRVTGRELKPSLPSFILPATRSGDGRTDLFLPASYVRPTGTYEVGRAMRGAEDARTIDHAGSPDEIVVLELEDGGTLITSVSKLHETLERSHPEWIDGDRIAFDKLCSGGAVTSRGLGDALGGLIQRVFTFVVGEARDQIIDDAREELTKHKGRAAELGITWLGTKALMWAIEKRLDQEPGLYCWSGMRGGADDLVKPDPKELERLASEGKPMLVFVHGTASNSLGSFGELRKGDRDAWAALENRFNGGIYAFEHRTLSESPIDNALQLAKELPNGANLSLVSHSRGGLVADLLCLSDFQSHIGLFAREKHGTDDIGLDNLATSLFAQLDDAYGQHREVLAELARELSEKQFNVQRYVRTASPANGTKLASGNFDVFLSGLLSLIGKVPFLQASSWYHALKRVVIEIAKNRTNPRLVPGIEAMLPDSPMARFLHDADVRPGLAMSVIAGDIEGGNLLKKLGVLLTDLLLFDLDDNDLVVNTTAMLAGVAPKAKARVLFDRGADVSHFNYFKNAGTRNALRDWLTVAAPQSIETFQPLPDARGYEVAIAAAKRDVLANDRPVVVVLPGIMGTHLQVGADRIWLDPLDLAKGDLEKIKWGVDGVSAEKLFDMFYGKLCNELARSHCVVPFPYDWRQPLDVLGDRLGDLLEDLLHKSKQPIRLLAHSMGGLVVRACIYKRRAVMDAVMARDEARLIMLGTPNQGAHSMVENLIGKGDTVRTLARLDLRHDMQELLDIVAGFRGALQLLPRPGFVDMFQGQPDGGAFYDYGTQQTWAGFRGKVKDFWFGNGKVGQPTQETLDAAFWLWKKDGEARPSLPEGYEKKSAYVFGVARNTPCGVREEDGRLRMIGTTRGDGTVTWESGRIGGFGDFYYMPAEHGDLPSTQAYFPALVELLVSGKTRGLERQPPAIRAIERAVPVRYEAGPPALESPDIVARIVIGASRRSGLPPQRVRRLDVRVRATDLRFVECPVLVGHYLQDPIAGPQALIDREILDGDLSARHNLGLYAGPLGTATAAIRPPNEAERRRGTLRGAIVTGLGPYNGTLGGAELAEAVRAGALRYLLQVVDVLGTDDREVSLAALLLGYNSAANLTIEASVEALVSGVMNANASFAEKTKRNIRIARLDIIELYLDTAISAAYALRDLEPRLAQLGAELGTDLACQRNLEQSPSARPRLFDSRATNYWPRLIVTGGSSVAAPCPSPNAGGEGEAPETRTSDRLSYVYVGQRARAESEQVQCQPGLVESLIRQQIGNPVWDRDFGRTLFQLLVPSDFKDSARKFGNLVLVVDETTANLPWELMYADDLDGQGDNGLPLAVRALVVRQFSTDRYRPRIRQSVSQAALVIGNPSIAGFAAAFSTDKAPIDEKLLDLPKARDEAKTITDLLTDSGYDVESLIEGERAVVVMKALYRKPWRILHIAAHGVFGMRHRDGRFRSGVVLSDGLLITAAEIAAMEVVPEIVVLSCCHLGKVEGTPEFMRDRNLLAASVARELIDKGVRCVVVAGWAVADDGAQRFGEVFYKALLTERKSFGEAVFDARRAAWDHRRTDITWGAFQAYGDPGWQVATGQAERQGNGRTPVSPDEVLDELARIRIERSRTFGRKTTNDRSAKAAIQALAKRCPDEWLVSPAVLSAFGHTYYDLSEWEEACKWLAKSIASENANGQVPIHDIEKLANAEARFGEQTGKVELVDRAIDRLIRLESATASPPGENAEQRAVLGSAHKRKASLLARRLLELANGAKPAEHTAVERLRASLSEALASSRDAYASVESSPEERSFSPYQVLNRFALDAVVGGQSEVQISAGIALARTCGRVADLAFKKAPDFWNAEMGAEALLVERMLDGSLHNESDADDSPVGELERAYMQAMEGVVATPAEMDSVLAQMELLSRFFDALSISSPEGQHGRRTADRLLELVKRLQPRRPERTDRPNQSDRTSERDHESGSGIGAKSRSSKSVGQPKLPTGKRTSKGKS